MLYRVQYIVGEVIGLNRGANRDSSGIRPGSRVEIDGDIVTPVSSDLKLPCV